MSRDPLSVVVQHAPCFSVEDARDLARSLYGLDGRTDTLPSERDQNFHILDEAGREFVLKIANATESFELLDFQNQAIAHIARAAAPVEVPRVVTALDESAIVRASGPDGRSHFVRLLTWVPGVPLARVRPHTPALLRSLGRRLAAMDQALADFMHPAMDRPFPWDLKGAGWARGDLILIRDPVQRTSAQRVLDRFEGFAAPMLRDLRPTVIHNDWNDYNVLVALPARPEREVVGAIDFGDMVRSPTVCDLAVGMAYAMLDKRDPIAAGAAVVAGYHDVRPLSEIEISLLFDLVCVRLCLSVVMAARQQSAAPNNDYLQISQRPVGVLLAALDSVSRDWAHYVFRHACGLDPCPRAARVVDWIARNADQIAPVVDLKLDGSSRRPADNSDSPLVFDLSPGSLELGTLDEIRDVRRFTELLVDRIRAAGAGVGIGRYDEARLVYSGAQFVQPGNDGEEPRTIHIGVDLFLPAGSPVYAPLDGVVHSFQDNAAPLDYGPTIILTHQTDEGIEFHTLYGHLSRESLHNLREGASVRRGNRIATLGDIDVNGGWPPHLHFQLIADLLGRRGDFPGVAAPNQREIWLSLCPNPNGLLRAAATVGASRPSAAATILEGRRRHLGRNLSVSYRRPLTIVRGFMQHLFDADGRRYLDGVNNVAHVGHCHPRVVRAEREQAAVLNTNTRYLHESIVRYAERLTAMLPEPLGVCYLVNSGSEANELALRLARAYTGGTALVVLDGAYHGNTSSLIDISPYKCEGPGGKGLPPHVRKVSMPDLYRGRWRADAPTASARYAKEVEEVVAQIRADDRRLAAFICESLLSCGGQIVLPEGYLSEVYRATRGAGGVCIADEVQIGFGRVGSHMWGFESQGVVPDIVTLGKPIGNGYPLGAVVTTAEIAASFDNGMEFFSTFGGNPVACAVGLAVLDVVEQEQLQQRALDVGTRLMAGLASLQERQALVGDVRGLGLFNGIELVLDRESRTPAPRQASYVVNRMRDRGVLLSTDGPDHNVIKIKPPLVFDGDDADVLVATLDEILLEDPAQPRS